MVVKTDMVGQLNVVVASKDHDYLIFSISFRLIPLSSEPLAFFQVSFCDTYTDTSFNCFPDGLAVYLPTFENSSSCINQHQRKWPQPYDGPSVRRHLRIVSAFVLRDLLPD